MTTELQAAAVELESAFDLLVGLARLQEARQFQSDGYRGIPKAEQAIRAYIAAQSSEIERLRDAIIQYVICCPADRDTTNDFLKASYKLDEVLAQGAKK